MIAAKILRSEYIRSAGYIIKLMPKAYPDEWMFTMKEGGVQGSYQGFGLN